MNRIKSFEEACAVLGIDPIKSLPDVTNVPEEFREAIISHYKMMIVAKVLNGDWKPDWSDSSQWKYWPWFYYKSDPNSSSGFRLSYLGCDCDHTYSYVGSRLCFKDSATAEYAGTEPELVKLYEGFHLPFIKKD